MAEKYLVEGYEFDSVEAANEAKKELEAVKFMSQKTNGCTPEMAYKVYSKIVDNNLFHTEIGFDYLRALEEFLMQNGMFDVPGVDSDQRKNAATEPEPALKETAPTENQTVNIEFIEEENTENSPLFAKKKERKPKEKKVKETKEKVVKEKPVKEKVSGKKKERTEDEQFKITKDLLVSSVILNALLGIGIIIMIYIASTSSNINILNYETALQDKYSSWAEELKAKENAIREREKEVKKREDALNEGTMQEGITAAMESVTTEEETYTAAVVLPEPTDAETTKEPHTEVHGNVTIILPD